LLDELARAQAEVDKIKARSAHDEVVRNQAKIVHMHGDKEVKVTVKVADDTALGEFTVKVTGHPTSGADATNEFKITVAKK